MFFFVVVAVVVDDDGERVKETPCKNTICLKNQQFQPYLLLNKACYLTLDTTRKIKSREVRTT